MYYISSYTALCWGKPPRIEVPLDVPLHPCLSSGSFPQTSPTPGSRSPTPTFPHGLCPFLLSTLHRRFSPFSLFPSPTSSPKLTKNIRTLSFQQDGVPTPTCFLQDETQRFVGSRGSREQQPLAFSDQRPLLSLAPSLRVVSALIY